MSIASASHALSDRIRPGKATGIAESPVNEKAGFRRCPPVLLRNAHVPVRQAGTCVPAAAVSFENRLLEVATWLASTGRKTMIARKAAVRSMAATV